MKAVIFYFRAGEYRPCMQEDTFIDFTDLLSIISSSLFSIVDNCSKTIIIGRRFELL